MLKSTLAYLLRTITLNKGIRANKSWIKINVQTKAKNTHTRRNIAHLKVNKKHIKCLSNKTFTEHQINLIPKGLKFIQINPWWQNTTRFGNNSCMALYTVQEECTSNTCDTEKKNFNHPFHIKSKRNQPVQQMRTKDKCKMKEGHVWKSCREQTTLIQ